MLEKYSGITKTSNYAVVMPDTTVAFPSSNTHDKVHQIASSLTFTVHTMVLSGRVRIGRSLNRGIIAVHCPVECGNAMDS